MEHTLSEYKQQSRIKVGEELANKCMKDSTKDPNVPENSTKEDLQAGVKASRKINVEAVEMNSEDSQEHRKEGSTTDLNVEDSTKDLDQSSGENSTKDSLDGDSTKDLQSATNKSQTP